MRYNITPCPKPRMSQRDKWAKRPCVMKYRAFKDQCRLRRVKLPESFRVVFHIPMPKSWSKAKRLSMWRKPHTQKPDIDNLLKGLLDAVLKEDAHVFDVRAEKRWSLKPAIEVEEL